MAENDKLIAYYKQQFVEIYHLDTLDWRVALILFPTFGGFFGVLGYLNVFSGTTNELLTLGFDAFRAFSIFLIFLAFYGMWTVARNQVWLKIRTELIGKIEAEMNVSKIWESVVKKTRLSMLTFRRLLLFPIYSVLLYFSLTVVLVDSIADWKICVWWGVWITIILSLVCIVIQGCYLIMKLKK